MPPRGVKSSPSSQALLTSTQTVRLSGDTGSRKIVSDSRVWTSRSLSLAPITAAAHPDRATAATRNPMRMRPRVVMVESLLGNVLMPRVDGKPDARGRGGKNRGFRDGWGSGGGRPGQELSRPVISRGDGGGAAGRGRPHSTK